MMQNVLTQRNVTYCSWRCDDGATVIAEGIGNLQYLLDHVDAVLHGCPAAGSHMGCTITMMHHRFLEEPFTCIGWSPLPTMQCNGFPGENPNDKSRA